MIWIAYIDMRTQIKEQEKAELGRKPTFKRHKRDESANMTGMRQTRDRRKTGKSVIIKTNLGTRKTFQNYLKMNLKKLKIKSHKLKIIYFSILASKS